MPVALAPRARQDSDAQIAALAMGANACLHTADADFLRVAGLQWQNPLAGVRSQ